VPPTAAQRSANQAVAGVAGAALAGGSARLAAVPATADHPGRTSRATAPNTRRAYDSDWSRFHRWCLTHGHRSLPADPGLVAGYLREAASIRTPDGGHAYSVATLARWATAIGHRHRACSLLTPTTTDVVRQALSRIRADYRTAEAALPRRSAPLLTADIVAMVGSARRDTTSWAGEVFERRDSALLLLGYAGALRRSELVSLLCGDVAIHRHEGLRLAVTHARHGDQPTPARLVPCAQSADSCPPCAALRWMHVVAAFDTGGRASVIRLLKSDAPFDEHLCDGPVPRMRARAPFFRAIRKNGNLSAAPLSGASMHRVIRRRAQLAGYTDEATDQLGVQSLRAGFITQALRNGADRHAIVHHVGPIALATLDGYADRDPARTDHQPIGLGL
jgi:site-specific recombinase XerD